MLPADMFRTTVFRWTASLAVAFTLLSLLLFAFVYWQTAAFERRELDTALRYELHLLGAEPQGVAAGLATWLREDLHNVRYGLVTDGAGRKLAGNMLDLPRDLSLGAMPQTVTTIGRNGDDDDRNEVIRALASRLIDGRILVLGLDTDELDHIRDVILRALELGLLPMLAASLGAALLLGRRAALRVAALDKALRTLRDGRLAGRLPVTSSGHEFDRISASVNAMLDEIEQLVDEIHIVGDSIAHDLRTPLTRARARLERSRDKVTTPGEYRAIIDETLGWLDQTFEMITAVLRIGEIEHGLRRAGFAPVRLATIVTEVADLYGPLAEEKDISMQVVVRNDNLVIMGDRDLLLEAVVNLVDNAVKFTPDHGVVTLSLEAQDEFAVLSVADTGPGIDISDRVKVLRRFFRAERSRHSSGNGLGLALVKAVANLHGFGLEIGDNHPGCRINLRFLPQHRSVISVSV